MLNYVFSFFKYFFSKKDDIEDDLAQEDFLAEQLLDLEFKSQEKDEFIESKSTQDIPNDRVCFQRSGVITYMNDSNVLIDGMLYFDSSKCNLNLSVNDKVLYLGYKHQDDSVVVVRILENNGTYCGDGDEADPEERQFKVIEHLIVGEVDHREDRLVYMKSNDDVKFSLDDVEAAFIPIKGDWLELCCTVQWQEDKPADISAAQVLQVKSFKPVRSKIISSTITDWTGDSGICDKVIYFNRNSVPNGTDPKIGSKVMVEAIESSQGTCTWRAVKLIILDANVPEKDLNKTPCEDEVSLDIENIKNIEITYPVKFDNVDFQDNARLNLIIKNNSNQIYTINKWIMLSKKRDSQVEIKPFLSQPRKLYPQETFTLTITCYPKFLGNTKECLIIMFRGFQVKRFIEINILDRNISNQRVDWNDNRLSEQDKIRTMKNVRNRSENNFIPGVRPVKPPAFVPVKLGAFPIPDRVWNAVLGDSQETIYSSDFKQIVDRIENCLPCLSQDLNIGNYIDKWHILLYIEEVQANIMMRVYDTEKAFLIRCQEYLGIEINGLSERRPSLIKGDRVIVRDVWDPNSRQYEGYIHEIKGDLVLMKFNQQFHESYNGSDVSIEYHFSRSTYRRAHQAINLAISNLGVEMLFPTKMPKKNPQISPDKISNITWFNKKLNTDQKAAVTNILLGECRPLPYCIYGPPGTGKTFTVIETILQILSNIPHSRILVATPSNSASNLITERLIEYQQMISVSIVRIIANYLLGSENLPDAIKPYCATLDIAREETAKSRHTVRDGVNVNCQTSYIGRHRVTIGTCYSIGTLAQMGLPKNHFTHIIIDEAGQATEPEIMIPMTFTDKENGQIILAGDPMQLGPVIISKYCIEFGMDESYLTRILESYPYQRDYDAFANGFNNKLVTKLNENYRSLTEVLTLPSQMFYDGSLVEKIDRHQKWISNMIETVTEMFGIEEKSGGIFVYGIKGFNSRAEDSPSWYNPQEASMVALTACKLFKRNISAEDIGVITPYIAQTKYIRLLFDAMGLPRPKIGTVEEFQGQERPIILISTVRSTESLLPEDQKHSLGFVKSPKRLNVALTRAQVAVLLFCNPHLLCTDNLWRKVIANSVKEDKYTGCDLPHHMLGIN